MEGFVIRGGMLASHFPATGPPRFCSRLPVTFMTYIKTLMRATCGGSRRWCTSVALAGGTPPAPVHGLSPSGFTKGAAMSVHLSFRATRPLHGTLLPTHADANKPGFRRDCSAVALT